MTGRRRKENIQTGGKEKDWEVRQWKKGWCMHVKAVRRKEREKQGRKLKGWRGQEGKRGGEWRVRNGEGRNKRK